MSGSDVRMSRGEGNWNDGDFLTVTFCVTENCNLACSYCYMVNKNTGNKMSLEVGKQIVDFVLEDEYTTSISDYINFDFIGGEPLLEMEMIDKLCDYILIKLYTMNHKWLYNHMFTFSTNAILYNSEIVKKFVEKHKERVSFGLSLDGIKEKHDMCRIKKDGTGSYNDVMNGVSVWLEDESSGGVKSTFASDDLIYLKDSMIHLWNIGIKDVNSNVVYENTWKEGDDELYEKQLKDLADYVIDNDLYDKYSVSYFQPSRGLPLNKDDLKVNRCGAGYKSLAFDYNGDIYACIHFLDICFDNNKANREQTKIGSINSGINKEQIRALVGATWLVQSPDKCNKCDVGYDCGWCLALNWNESKTNDMYERTTYICDMHKANVRALEYFWRRYERKTGYTSPRTVAKIMKKEIDAYKWLYFITADNVTPHCNYESNIMSNKIMDKEIIQKGLDFCIENSMIPVFLGECEHGLNPEKKMFHEIIGQTTDVDKNVSVVSYKNDIILDNIKEQGLAANILVKKDDLKNLFYNAAKLLSVYKRLNLFVQDLSEWEDKHLKIYEDELEKISCFIVEQYKKNNKVQMNVLMDLMLLMKHEKRDCGAGINSIALAPNGRFYVCPGFYFEGEDNSIGDLDHGIDKSSKRLLYRDKSPICIDCENDSCNRCLHLNKKIVGNVNVPSGIQCKLNYIQAKKTEELRDKLIKDDLINVEINKDVLTDNYVDYVQNVISTREKSYNISVY